MKKIEVTEEFYCKAKKLAQDIQASKSYHDNLRDFIFMGYDANNHVLADAAAVGGWEEEFQETVRIYTKEANELRESFLLAKRWNARNAKKWRNAIKNLEHSLLTTNDFLS